ncbi:MAG TPA: hypothetical protein VMF30_11000 [Pirellulales bacterium]|nr:hypothetical protein [Pirellulales bacterium]
MLRRPCLGSALVAVTLMGSTSFADAAIVSATDGGETVAIDTATGLEWLDASNTLGMVVSTAQADFPSFQLATEGQVETLIEDAGFPANQLPDGGTTDSTSGNLLATTLGYSYNTWVQYYGSEADGWEYQSQAYFLDGASTGVDEVALDARNPPLGSDGTYVNFYSLGDSFGTGSSTNFILLIKATPEPSSAALFGCALLVLGFARNLLRRKR